MEVILLERIQKLGELGDKVTVKSGYGRNYLIPKRLAAPATHNYLQKIEKLKKNASDVRVKRLDGMKEIASAIDNTRHGPGLRVHKVVIQQGQRLRRDNRHFPLRTG